jgi:hypothetical protein
MLSFETLCPDSPKVTVYKHPSDVTRSASGLEGDMTGKVTNESSSLRVFLSAPSESALNCSGTSKEGASSPTRAAQPLTGNIILRPLSMYMMELAVRTIKPPILAGQGVRENAS